MESHSLLSFVNYNMKGSNIMIRFFRKIRQNLIEKNNFKKYFIYAIGEVLIVMIGILIALQINNWNEDKILRGTEVALLKEMKKNLEVDLSDIRYNINYTRKSLNANEIVFESLKYSESYNDTLNFYYANISFGLSNFTNNTSAYDNLKSIGFYIIKNDSLRIRITKLYSNRYNYLIRLEENYYDNFHTNELLPIVISNIITDSIKISAKPINLSELALNHKFKETIKANIMWLRYMVTLYANIEKEIVTLINQIESENKSHTN